MKTVIQRVVSASVLVEGAVVGGIGRGITVFLGVERGDDESKADWLAQKIVNLRIFPDDDGKMNLSVVESGGSLLIVSQFTLAGNCAKGKRPSFDSAARPDEARRVYEYFVEAVKQLGVTVATGIFQADMRVALVNDGPVTFILER